MAKSMKSFKRKSNINESELSRIITKHIKNALYEFNHMLYGKESDPYEYSGNVNLAEGVADHSKFDIEYITSVLDKYGLPTEMYVRYPDSDMLSDECKKEFNVNYMVAKSVHSPIGSEQEIINEYINALMALEEYPIDDYFDINLYSSEEDLW